MLREAPREVVRLVIQEIGDLLLVAATNLFRLLELVKAKMAAAGMEKVFYDIMYEEIMDTVVDIYSVVVRAMVLNMTSDARAVEAIVAIYKRYM